MALHRQVFPTDEVPHKWAHQAQDAARNPQGNLYFKGATIYSYRDSWPLARIYERKGARLVLANCARYSVTTAAHQNAVNRACSHMPSLAVPVVENRYGRADLEKEEHARNLDYFIGEMVRLHREASRVMTESGATWRADHAAQLHKGMVDYMLFFGIRRKAPALLSFADAIERARRIENPDLVRDAARIKAREARAKAAGDVEEYREEMARSMRAAGHFIGYRGTHGKRWAQTLARLIGQKGDDRAEFLRVGCGRTDWRMGHPFEVYNRHASGAVMLRVVGEEIQTSQGARIPLAAAPMVWRMVEHARENGGRNYEGRLGYKIGDYRVTRIDADGTLVVGCHSIPHSELRAMARTLDLA